MKVKTLVRIKPEWRDPGERDIPYVIVHDYGDSSLIQPLPQYMNMAILPTQHVRDECLIPFDDADNYPEEQN